METKVKAGSGHRGEQEGKAKAMKKKITLEISEEAALKARRRARRVVGPVKPRQVIEPATKKAPKHRKQEAEREIGGE
jgi:hypothetical protein